MSRNDFRRRQAQRQRRKLVRHLPIILALFLAFSALASGVFALTRFVLNRQPISSASASSSTTKTASEDLAQPVSSPASGTLAQAAYIAAGYDYDRAIALIKEDSWKRSHLMRKQRLLSYQLMCRTFPMYFSILLSWTLPKPLTATAGLPATIPS